MPNQILTFKTRKIIMKLALQKNRKNYPIATDDPVAEKGSLYLDEPHETVET